MSGKQYAGTKVSGLSWHLIAPLSKDPTNLGVIRRGSTLLRQTLLLPGVQENLFPGESKVSTGSSPLPTVSALFASNACSGSFKNSCLFFHLTWLSANSSLYAGEGGGSVIFVIRYAVEASAIP